MPMTEYRNDIGATLPGLPRAVPNNYALITRHGFLLAAINAIKNRSKSLNIIARLTILHYPVDHLGTL